MPLNSSTIVTTSLADEIAFQLQSEILDGALSPGAHLTQDELCARFGVSRTPVREALRKLQAMHLVQVLPNRGATVRVPSRRELQEIYAVRARLEAFACELAAQQITDRSLAELDTAQELVERALELEHDALQNTEREAAFNAQITQANELFHGVIHRVADNERLRVLINELQWYFPKDYVWRAQRSSEEIRALNIEEHLTIRNALAARDAASAARAMEKHIVHAGTLLLAYLDEPGTKGPEA